MHPKHIVLASAVLSTFIAGHSQAAIRTWVGGSPTGNYFDLSANWSGGTPGALDTARFDLGTTYNVFWDNFTANTTNAGLEVFGGNVTFKRDTGDPRTHTVTTADFNAGRLTLSDFTLSVTTAGDINFDNLGRLDVNAAATLAAPSASLQLGNVGSNAENLFVIANGVANTRSAIIGSSTGLKGRATINGASGRWNMSEDIYVGNLGMGALEITTGAIVTNRSG